MTKKKKKLLGYIRFKLYPPKTATRSINCYILNIPSYVRVFANVSKRLKYSFK